MLSSAAARRTLAASAALVALVASPAHAHVGGAADGLAHGALHPLLGVDHLLAMLAVGLWAAQRGGRSVWLLPVTFIVTMLAGAVIGTFGLALPAVEAGIGVSVLVLGALVAAAVRVPTGAGVAVVALFALLHGHAHGSEMPATVSGLAYGAGFALATAALHAAGLLLALAVRRGSAGRGAFALRLAGAAIGVGGVALAAL